MSPCRRLQVDRTGGSLYIYLGLCCNWEELISGAICNFMMDKRFDYILMLCLWSRVFYTKIIFQICYFFSESFL